MLKSTKLGFIKNERKDKNPDLKISMHAEARNDIESATFIQCGKIEVHEEPKELIIPSIESIKLNRSYMFVLNMPEDGQGADSLFNVAIVKHNNRPVAYIYGSVYVNNPSWALIMRVDLFEGRVVFKDPFKAIGKKFPEEAFNNREKLAGRALSVALTFNQYGYELVDDLVKTLALRNVPYSIRHTYNNYAITKCKMSDVEIINTIEYTYEATVLDLEATMLENLPFNKFYLKIGFIGDEIEPVYALFDHGKLHGIIKPKGRGSIVSVGYVDLNEAKLGSPINVSVSKVKGFLAKDGYDIQDVALMLNILSKAYIEFMYKFHRLVPYSENVSNSYSEHVTRVTNNTSVHKVVILNPDSKKRSTQGHKGGTHASPREHVRIGHARRYKSGKEIWIDEKTINEGKVGKITKTYQMVN